MTYDRLSTEALRGTTQADCLVALDAHLRVIDGGVTVCAEPGFPVVELARSLLIWLGDPADDFAFDSMSYEEVGSIAIRQVPNGWEFGSTLAPGTVTAPVPWAEVDRCCRRFIGVESDLVSLGLDPTEVIGR